MNVFRKVLKKSGQALQDIINEIGRRLDYKVENGLYAGRTNAIGNDGLWFSPEGHALVVEVKTSDAYRLSLDTIASYREALLRAGRITQDSSILLVVGRQGTGELEAQVRGSRHAWDVRLISAEALVKLVLLKENSDQEETGRKIRSVLIPVEYTRVDALVDVVFAAASDVDSGLSDPATDQDTFAKSEGLSGAEPTDRSHVNKKRDEITRALSSHLGKHLIKKSRAMWWSADHSAGIACTVSKRYETGHDYWYAFHPRWQEFLEDGQESYFVLGCADLDRAFAIPINALLPLLPRLNTTETERHMYWHIQLNVDPVGQVHLIVPRNAPLDLEQYAVSLSSG